MSQTLLEILKRHKSSLLAAGMASMVAWVAVSGTQGIRELLEKREQIRQLEERNAELEADNLRRRQRIERLENSPSDQDIEIRKLNMLKPGETTFMLPEAEKQKQDQKDSPKR